MTTLASTLLRNHSRLRHSSLNFAVEALIDPVLPWLSGINQRHFDASLLAPAGSPATRTLARCPIERAWVRHGR